MYLVMAYVRRLSNPQVLLGELQVAVSVQDLLLRRHLLIEHILLEDFVVWKRLVRGREQLLTIGRKHLGGPR